MRKIICLGGEPATGKSTIIKRFMSFGTWESTKPRKLVDCEFDKKNNIYIIGKYVNIPGLFPGCDVLSMAVQPEASIFVKETLTNVLFEGDRLFNQSFLEMIAEEVECELIIVHITADKDIIAQRHRDRKDTQNETFLKGRKTKYENLRSNFTLMPYTKVFENNNEKDLENIVSFLKFELYLE